MLFCCAPFSGKAQAIKQNIRGFVFDQATRKPLTGASVRIENASLQRGTNTDEEGKFLIEGVPVGRYDLRVNYLGYATVLQQGLSLNSAQELILEIGLEEQAIKGEGVEIVADQRKVTNEAAVVSARSFSVEELRRIPGGIDDPARMAVKFPGITPNPSVLVNELSVRGNGARAVIWRLEGIDIYNPNH
ncbi:MAG: carboxypeptidase-like regulatory domain-containing protein, partial [Bacteroidota bacterium]